jgi:hypothetical protein
MISQLRKSQLDCERMEKEVLKSFDTSDDV